MRDWYVRNFDAKAWEAVKQTIATETYTDQYSDFFGAIMFGAVCFDLVLREIDAGEWLFCADPYILGIDSGYGYTEDGTPYDEHDGFALKFDVAQPFDEALASFIKQIDTFTDKDAQLTEYAAKTDRTWKEEE